MLKVYLVIHLGEINIRLPYSFKQSWQIYGISKNMKVLFLFFK